MRPLKPSWLKGTVIVTVKGHYPERFFDLCVRHHIPVWAITKQSDLECSGQIHLSDIHRLRQLRRKTRYKLYFKGKLGMPFLIVQLKKLKIQLFSLVSALLFFLYLSQSVWFINIDGVTAEMEKDMLETLTELGVKRGKLKLLMDGPSEIQQQLLAKYPEILWVGVTTSGTSYRLEVVSKKQMEEDQVKARTHLYAKKDGVITDIFVAKGRPLVEVNDFVKKGQLLVTGELVDDPEHEQQSELTAVEARIKASTWYESEISTPLTVKYQTETGESVNKYYLNIGSLAIPIWGFRKHEFDQIRQESKVYTAKLGNWQLPLAFTRLEVKETETIELERSEEEAIKAGINQAKRNLIQQLGTETEIMEEKILHQTIENGKVNIHVYFTVIEDIVNTIESDQGD